ncbi:MAG: flagellar basal body rod protein FlgB [Caulobacteraceae bacterium]|nr:flagellar basal body rod protein FlgB [Caulobacteraceae bacterium]
MRLDDIPLFAMLKGRLGYLSARERVIAENVANADTAGYQARDIAAPSFDQAMRAARSGAAASGSAGGLTRTNAMHLAPPGQSNTPYAPQVSPDSETRQNGNSVVLEEQMLKMAESRMNYDAAISFYQKSLNLLRMASRAPGR